MKALFLPTGQTPCYTEAEYVCFVLGEIGWRPVYGKDDSFSLKALMEKFYGIVPQDVIHSVIGGSMFGWDAPVAELAKEWFRDKPDLPDEILKPKEH